MEEPRRSGHVTYRSYLLRLWQTMDGDRKVWRVVGAAWYGTAAGFCWGYGS